MQARSYGFETALQDLAALLHRIALAQSLPQAISSDDPDREAIQTLAGTLAPEDVQLYYQIALQGRADLSLAPDEYAGFTMPLLRMLAFAPEGNASGEARPKPATVSQPAPASKPAAARKPEVGASPAGTPAPARNPALITSAEWHELIPALKIGGMARMLAQHSELVEQDADRLVLMVPEAHRHLLDKPYRDKLQAALEERFGRKLRVEFTLGQATGNTPAEREDQERQARQRTAIEAIDRDPFVRELVENFDARVVDESIRPLQPAPGGAGEGQ